MKMAKYFSKWESESTCSNLERTPVISSFDEINSKKSSISVFNNKLTEICILQNNRSIEQSQFNSIYLCKDTITCISTFEEKALQSLAGEVIGIPASVGSHSIQGISNVIAINHLSEYLSADIDYHYTSRPWSVSKVVAKGTLLVGHTKWGRQNGRKFIATSIYKKFERELDKGNNFYVPSDDGIFPILISRDVFLSTANRDDGQDFHCHQNTIEILMAFGKIELTFYDLRFDSLKHVCLDNGGLVIIPSLVYHEIKIVDDNEMFFIGVRETDAGNDKHTVNPFVLREELNISELRIKKILKTIP